MKRKFKNKLIVLLLALMSLFLLGGCSFSQTLDEFRKAENLKVHITYYVNGGSFSATSDKKKELYYKVDDYPLEITEATATISGGFNISREGYLFLGWYEVVEVKDEAQGLCELGAKFDFTKPLQEGDLKIAAKWQKDEGVRIVMAQVIDEDMSVIEDATIEVGDAKDYIAEGKTSFTVGEELGEIAYDYSDQLRESSASPDSKLFTVKDKEYTFYGYYADPECQTAVAWPLTRGTTQTTIYAKYLKGDWSFVKTEDDVVIDMFGGGGLARGDRYWLMNDIDCTGSTVIPLTQFAGTIKGNGYAIQNLSVEKDVGRGDKLAFLGNLTETARIENVDFENLTIKYTSTKNTFITEEFYFVFLSKHADATISDVNMQGTMTIKGASGSAIANMENGGKDHCLYGGYTLDSAYIEESQGNGFNVSGSIDDIVILDIE